MYKNRSFAYAVCAALLASGCRDTSSPPTNVDITSSFEGTLEGWQVFATDVHVAGNEIPWHITPSTALAFKGSRSLEFQMANFTDAGKIWVARKLALEPNKSYSVTISYELGTKDWGFANLFALITGALPTSPRTGPELEPTFIRNATGNGSQSDVGYRWLHKEFNYTALTDSNGALYVVVGIWGTFEVTRTYYIDALHVTARPVS